MAILDRSWYGRVLVERIEGFATGAEWERAYDEINDFEKMLADEGVVLVKLWPPSPTRSSWPASNRAATTR